MSKLPPLDLKEDIEKYDAVSETKEVFKERCDHKKVRIVDNEIRCVCGAAWGGPNIARLAKAMGIINI